MSFDKTPPDGGNKDGKDDPSASSGTQNEFQNDKEKVPSLKDPPNINVDDSGEALGREATSTLARQRGSRDDTGEDNDRKPSARQDDANEEQDRPIFPVAASLDSASSETQKQWHDPYCDDDAASDDETSETQKQWHDPYDDVDDRKPSASVARLSAADISLATTSDLTDVEAQKYWQVPYCDDNTDVVDADDVDDRKPAARQDTISSEPRYVPDDPVSTNLDSVNDVREKERNQQLPPTHSTHSRTPVNDDEEQSVDEKHASRRSSGSSVPGPRWIVGTAVPTCEPSRTVTEPPQETGENRSVGSLEHNEVNNTANSNSDGLSTGETDVDSTRPVHIVTATMVDEETALTSEVPIDAHIQEIPRAQAVSERQIKRKRYIIAGSFVVGLIVIVLLAVGLGRKGDDTMSGTGDSTTNNTDFPTTKPSPPSTPTLERLLQEGILRCGVAVDLPGFGFFNKTTGVLEGFEVDLCRAVAAALFGNGDRVDFIPSTLGDKFSILQNGTIDVQARFATHTMERHVFEQTSRIGFAFTIPCLYDGLHFGGVPSAVACAEEKRTTDECNGTVVCVNEGTTDFDILGDLFPRQSIEVLPYDTYGQALTNGTCNVVSGELLKIAERAIRDQGYIGRYTIGNKTFSKEPLAIVTRGNDVAFSDFVNWVLQSLLVAEKRGVTQDTASMMETTQVFGAEFENMFINAVRSVGNYAEVYMRHLSASVERTGLNLINNGTALIYSQPVRDDAKTTGPPPFTDGTLARILSRGNVVCGVTTLELHRLGADYCMALSAGIFGPGAGVTIVNLTDSRFDSLANGDIDALSNAPVTLASDVVEPTTGQGFAFSQPFFYRADGEALALATREDDPQWSAFVYWIVTATFHAEESNISQDKANEMPLVGLFGPDLNRMFRDAIVAVGNYGEIYNRSVESDIPRSGRNLLNEDGGGPQFYVPPDWSLR